MCIGSIGNGITTTLCRRRDIHISCIGICEDIKTIGLLVVYTAISLAIVKTEVEVIPVGARNHSPVVTVLDVEDDSLTIKVNLLPGHRLHYHSHAHRDETWTIVSGEGRAVIDDAEIVVKPGVMLRLPAGCRHTLIADTEMTVIEVQIGTNIDVHDKIKYSLEDRYGKHK